MLILAPPPIQAMIYLIAAQPPPSIQDFSDLEQALIGSTGEEDVQTKTETVKAAFQWVRRFAFFSMLHRPCIVSL
jgi:hypothetical protein